MKKKIVIIGIIVILIMILTITAYFLIIDIQSKIPEDLKEKYGVETMKFQDRNVFTILQSQEQTRKYILYFHGGSYMAEMTKMHWQFLDKLVQKTGLSVIVPDYPLTPKHNYKDVFEMVEPLYKEIIKTINPQNIIMMGDSAGGGLALALEEKLSEEGVELPNKLILISPWIDVTMSNPEIENVEEYDQRLNKDALKFAGIAYAGSDGMDSYLVNPINGPLSKLKNVVIYTGTYDILYPDVKILVERAKNANVDINLKEYEKAEHIWIIHQENELAIEALEDLAKNCLTN